MGVVYEAEQETQVIARFESERQVSAYRTVLSKE